MPKMLFAALAACADEASVGRALIVHQRSSSNNPYIYYIRRTQAAPGNRSGNSRETSENNKSACHDAPYVIDRIIVRLIIHTPAFDGKRKQGLCLSLSQATLCLVR